MTVFKFSVTASLKNQQPAFVNNALTEQLTHRLRKIVAHMPYEPCYDGMGNTFLFTDGENHLDQGIRELLETFHDLMSLYGFVLVWNQSEDEQPSDANMWRPITHG
jgi:hypothetical protein